MPVSQTYFGVIKFKRCHLIFRRSPSLAAFPPSVFVVCIRDEISLSFASFLRPRNSEPLPLLTALIRIAVLATDVN